MPYSYTGLIYAFSAIVFGIVAYRFYTAWKEQKNFFSKIFAYLFFSLVFAFLIDGLIWEIIYLKNPKMLYLTVVDGFITFAIPLGVLGYLATYLRFPKIPPKYGFLLTALSSAVMGALNIFCSIIISSESGNFMIQEFYPIIGGLSSLVFIIPTFLIAVFFFQQAKMIEDRAIRIRSMGFGTAFMMVVLAAGFDIVFVDFTKSNSTITDMSIRM